MGTQQALRLFSIFGAFLIGFWLPLRLNGYVPNAGIETAFDVLISLVSLANIELRRRKLNAEGTRSLWISPGFYLDVLTAVPLSLLSYSVYGETQSWLLLLNLAAARHIRQIKPFLDQFHSLQPITYRLVPIAVTLPLVVHLLACLWLALGSGSDETHGGDLHSYVRAVYWATTTLTTVGYGDIVPKTILQMLFTLAVQILGVGVFGFVLSNVASVLSRQDAAREHHMSNLDRVETFMRIHKIPINLRGKIRAYYHYLWQNKKGYQDQSLLEGLPAKIQSELFLHINRSIIEKVPFLKGANRDLIEDLMNELEPRIYVPGEKIFRVDEPGDALYLIHSGDVAILARDGSSIARLGEGAFFGEMALISERTRNASARAESFCDVYVLERAAFERVTRAYPEFKSYIEKVIAERSVG